MRARTAPSLAPFLRRINPWRATLHAFALWRIASIDEAIEQLQPTGRMHANWLSQRAELVATAQRLEP